MMIPEKEAPVLSIRHLNAFYGEREILHDLSFEAEAGEITAIVGESGSGKSTLLRSVMGLAPQLEITGGQILFKGEPLAGGKGVCGDKKRLRSLCGRDIAMVFQNASQTMDPLKTIGHLFYETVRLHDPKASREAITDRALQLMEMLRLKDCRRLLKSYPFELSGGMNQRIAIAAALMNHPSLLLADEPTSALDVAGVSAVASLLEQHSGSGKMAIVFVTHNMGAAARLADRIAVMRSGRIVEYGSRRHILTRPEHPYTRSLLAAVPKLKTGTEENKDQ